MSSSAFLPVTPPLPPKTSGFMGLPGASEPTRLISPSVARSSVRTGRNKTAAPSSTRKRKEAVAEAQPLKLTLRQQEALLLLNERGGVFNEQETAAMDGRVLKRLFSLGLLEVFGEGLRLTESGEGAAAGLLDPEEPMADGEEFRARCQAAFGGKGWQSRLAASTGVSRQTVVKWTSGRLAVPQYVLSLLDCLDALREAQVPYPPRCAAT